MSKIQVPYFLSIAKHIYLATFLIILDYDRTSTNGHLSTVATSTTATFFADSPFIDSCLTPSLPEYLMEFCKATLTFESADEIL